MDISHSESSMSPHLLEERGDKIGDKHSVLLYGAERQAVVCGNVDTFNRNSQGTSAA